MQSATLTGIGLKHSFHVHCQDRQGTALLVKKFRALNLPPFLQPARRVPYLSWATR